MRVKIQKWGNSMALRIPKSFAEQISIKLGCSVDLSIHDGKLVIEPMSPKNYSFHQKAILFGLNSRRRLVMNSQVIARLFAFLPESTTEKLDSQYFVPLLPKEKVIQKKRLSI